MWTTRRHGNLIKLLNLLPVQCRSTMWQIIVCVGRRSNVFFFSFSGAHQNIDQANIQGQPELSSKSGTKPRTGCKIYANLCHTTRFHSTPATALNIDETLRGVWVGGVGWPGPGVTLESTQIDLWIFLAGETRAEELKSHRAGAQKV